MDGNECIVRPKTQIRKGPIFHTQVGYQPVLPPLGTLGTCPWKGTMMWGPVSQPWERARGQRATVRMKALARVSGGGVCAPIIYLSHCTDMLSLGVGLEGKTHTGPDRRVFSILLIPHCGGMDGFSLRCAAFCATFVSLFFSPPWKRVCPAWEHENGELCNLGCSGYGSLTESSVFNTDDTP